MLIADTSVWIDFLTASGTPQAHRMRQAISDQDVIVIDPILLEIMSGARSDAVARTQRLIEAQQHEALFPKLDWLDAAVTIRSQIDALIAAAAIRLDVPVLHRDRDYTQISRHTALRVIDT